jgi:hypothetical protein
MQVRPKLRKRTSPLLPEKKGAKVVTNSSNGPCSCTYLTQICCEGYDLATIRILKPLQDDGCVEPTGVGEDNFLHLAGRLRLYCIGPDNPGGYTLLLGTGHTRAREGGPAPCTPYSAVNLRNCSSGLAPAPWSHLLLLMPMIAVKRFMEYARCLCAQLSKGLIKPHASRVFWHS